MTNLTMSILTLKGIERCPHCGIANPHMTRIWSKIFLDEFYKGTNYYIHWATFQCTSCNNLVLCKSDQDTNNTALDALNIHQELSVNKIFPSRKSVTEKLPPSADRYLRQALDSMHAPDGAVMLCASAIDSMLQEKDYKDGSLYSRITKAAEDGLITDGMAEWAHAVRLEANNPRHSDSDKPHMTEEDAEKVFIFANNLGMVLYELPAKIEEGKADFEPPAEDED